MSHDFLDAALRKSGAVAFKEKYVSEDSRANAPICSPNITVVFLSFSLLEAYRYTSVKSRYDRYERILGDRVVMEKAIRTKMAEMETS